MYGDGYVGRGFEGRYNSMDPMMILKALLRHILQVTLMFDFDHIRCRQPGKKNFLFYFSSLRS